MLAKGEDPSDIARFAILFAAKNILAMSEAAREKYPGLPIVYAGGVMRNAIIKDILAKSLPNVWFADTELSSDNAVGTAYLGLERHKREVGK
jgi:N6-L-threonylcarbamoyladenine synthase